MDHTVAKWVPVMTKVGMASIGHYSLIDRIIAQWRDSCCGFGQGLWVVSLTSQPGSSLVLNSQVYLLMVFWGVGAWRGLYTSYISFPFRKREREIETKEERDRDRQRGRERALCIRPFSCEKCSLKFLFFLLYSSINIVAVYLQPFKDFRFLCLKQKNIHTLTVCYRRYNKKILNSVIIYSKLWCFKLVCCFICSNLVYVMFICSLQSHQSYGFKRPGI